MADEQPTTEQAAAEVPAPVAESGDQPAEAPKGASLKAELEKILAADAMIVDHPKIDAEKTVGDVWDLMEEKQLDCLPIIEDETRVVRVITRNNLEIMKSVFFDAQGLEERQARIMCLPLNVVNQGQELKTIKTSENLAIALDLMCKNKIHSLPVIDDAGLFKGMLTSHGIFAKLVS